jgi:hypothetical protein
LVQGDPWRHSVPLQNLIVVRRSSNNNKKNKGTRVDSRSKVIGE